VGYDVVHCQRYTHVSPSAAPDTQIGGIGKRLRGRRAFHHLTKELTENLPVMAFNAAEHPTLASTSALQARARLTSGCLLHPFE
jgi:hypothetical protein